MSAFESASPLAAEDRRGQRARRPAAAVRRSTATLGKPALLVGLRARPGRAFRRCSPPSRTGTTRRRSPSASEWSTTSAATSTSTCSGCRCSFHASRQVGDLLYRLTADTYAIQTLTMNGIFPVVSAAMFLVGMTVVLVRIDWLLTLVALAVCPVLYLGHPAHDRPRSPTRRSRRASSRAACTRSFSTACRRSVSFRRSRRKRPNTAGSSQQSSASLHREPASLPGADRLLGSRQHADRCRDGSGALVRRARG